ncbi:MAG: glycine betaine ABC transporter substrate-binding protein [Trueperaceae bacterium]|nr:glycine betaine ABC transporter substrate-binding protein [Trueperaceae bacterium]
MKKLMIVFLAAATLLGGLAWAQENPIRVGSKQFTEQIVLGKMIVLALRDAGYDVTDNTNLGGTAVNRDALEQGEIDVYPNYNGTAISNWYRDIAWAEESIAENASGNGYLSYATVSSLDAAIFDLVWLHPAPANNTYVIAVRTDFAEENGLVTAADLADYVNAGNFFKFATNDEFANRPDGLPAFEETYGFNLTEDQLLVIAGATPAQTAQALAQGSNDVNGAMVYGTTGSLVAYDFTLLEDPQGAQPVFQPTPVFRGEVIRANPEIAGVLNPIFATLTNDIIQGLNARVDVDGENPEAVAQSYLEENGFVGGN